MKSKKFFILMGVCLAFVLMFRMALSAEAAIPKNGSVAVLTKGYSPQYNASTASIITRELIASGYKVVDPATLDKIRRSKAAAAALNGDVNAIMNLGRQYGFSTMVTADVEAGNPVINEFKLYTGTASVAVMVTSSGGSQLYADTASGKQVGYSPDEAAQKSVEATAKLAATRMVQ